MIRADDDACARNRSGRALTLAAAVLLVFCAASACDANGGSEADRDPTPTGAGKPSSTVTSGPLTLAELSRRPCRALDDEDLRSAELFIFTEPVQPNYDAKSCQWGAGGGLVSFTPSASTDETKAAKYSHLTRRSISGHRALLGSVTDHGREMFVLHVSVGKNQSFRLSVLPGEEGAPGPDGPTLATDFAKAILAHLR
ncbi:DUF3558 family protein [Streptomyces sp. 4N124]|uniref:DUF3558 family protein n=1 Tax=Streptomyces sp. 4N124 TaxID=3457420 RepID=UPI003FD260C3